MRRRLVYSLCAAALAVVSFNGPAFACGPFALDAIFTFTVHPAFPLERFARGEIGVVQPSYARSYLYVAYRELTGSPFSEKEQKSLTELWNARLEYNWELGDQEWIKKWLTVRQKVQGLPEPPKIGVYRNREKPNEYETYLNCQKDAFETAATTLAARIAKYGLENPSLKNWIEGQDQVFANCSEGRHIPAPALSTADALLRADRTYQIAAANFYAGDFDEAGKIFVSIAGDNHSPWQRIAPYLIARTLVRKASLGATEGKQQTLSEAENQLQKILADRKLTDLHAGATRLLDIVRNRLHPAERLHELARLLVSKNQDEGLKQKLLDYTVLLDNFSLAEGSENKSQPAEIRGDDLTDWITTLQSPTTQALDHSLARWQSTHAVTWLVAVLSKIGGKNPRSAALVSQAMTIKPGSPAFALARFHTVRLLIESGRGAKAGVLLDELLTTNRSQFDHSTLNLLIGQRMLLANSLAEFMTYAPRVPASFSWNDDGREIPAEASELPEESRALQGKLLFDGDAAHVFNQELPLAVFKEAATSTGLPSHLRRDVVQAAWLRAVLLGDNQTAAELVPTLKSVVPELSSLLDDFLSSTQPEAKRFSAIYAWLKFPGLEPVVDSGIGRTTPLGEQDVYRDNWWCSAANSSVPDGTGDETENQPRPFTARSERRVPAFLTGSQRAAAVREHLALNALGAAPSYLCQQVVQWVSRNPDEPRAPEALHLAVNTTRHGCTDKATGRWSKAAFDLLHRRYPNTTWAKKTPYWFKD